MTTGAMIAESVNITESGDPGALADLHALCFDEAWSRDAVAGVLGGPGAFGLIARAGGRARGFALGRAVGDGCELLAMGVLPTQRRRGLGRALLARVLARAAAAAAAAVFLEVAEDNRAARALYHAAGLRLVGRRKGYYRRRGGPPMTALVLRLEL
jgi:ribosomal-protein-alanine N-acetyltransferase